MVNISDKDNGIELRHKSLSLDAADAESIVEKIAEEFDDDGVDWKEKLVAS